MLSVNDNHTDTRHYFASHNHVALHNRRILIVEDEALVAMMIEDFLRDAGAEIVGTVGSVAEALYLIDLVAADDGLDGAVLDINLAGETATPIADRLTTLGVPFLFATGYGDARDVSQHAAAPIIHKPFAFAQLVTAVGSLTCANRSETVRP